METLDEACESCAQRRWNRMMKPLKTEKIIGGLLIVLVLLVLGHVAHNDFIQYDDPDFVTRNDHVQAGLSMEGIRRAFTTVVAANWNPVTTLSHMLDCQIYGLNPAGHHLTNLFFHLANVLLLFLLLRETTGSLWRSAAAAALFAVHPLHVESIAWVSERRDVLSVFWGLLAMIAYGRYARTRNKRSYIASLVLFALALMSKPMLVTLPFVLLLFDHWPLGRLRSADPNGSTHQGTKSGTGSLPALFIEKIPFFILSGISCVITLGVQQGAMSSLKELPVGTRILNAAVSYIAYLGKLVYPEGLAVFYPHPVTLHLSWWTIVALFLIVSISWILLWLAGREPSLLTGWLWFLGTLIPVIGLIQVGAQSMADRYAYFPSIGFFIMVVWGGERMMRFFSYRRIVLTSATISVLFGLSVVTWKQVFHWKDTKTLFLHTLSVTKNNWLAHNLLGVALSEERKNVEAEAEYRKALQIFPSYVAARNNLATLMLNTGKREEALTHFQRALAEDPDYYLSHIGLAETLLSMGKQQDALPHLLKAKQLLPDNSWAHDLLGLSFSKSGRYETALVEFRRAIELAPRRFDLYGHMGATLILQGRPEEAVHFLLIAIRLRPTYAYAYNNMGMALAEIGQLEQAAYYFSAALYLNPGYRDARENFNRTIATLCKRQAHDRH
jgi:Flp pilus assembly protein TadD